MHSDSKPGLVLLTGATGYIGGRLLTELEARGLSLRCLARRPEHLAARVGKGTEIVQGDLLDPASVRAAVEGVEVAYYLAHALGQSKGFEEQEKIAAQTFADAARDAGVRRIVYLGGLGHGELSPHLRSRHEVGRILRESGVPTIEFRASIVIGSGSLSFELIRALVQKLPVMVTPRWVRAQAQPIAIEDVIAYLVEALVVGEDVDGVFEIGGPDRASYLDIMREYGRQRGLRRWMIPVPVLSPRLSSLWLGLVTPLYARVGRKLVESLRNDTVVESDRALGTFRVRPRGLAAAISRALENEDRRFAETRWSDALSLRSSVPSWGGVRLGSRIVDSRSLRVPATASVAFRPIRRIGGRQGWYHANWLWRLRGFLDLLVGGVGLRRGRRDPEQLRPGDPLDFWRVERFEPDHLLLLQAEMRLPGRAWLQFEVDGEDGSSRITQTALFEPAGVLGLLYYYILYPIHRLAFVGMLRGIGRLATNRPDGGAADRRSDHMPP